MSDHEKGKTGGDMKTGTGKDAGRHEGRNQVHAQEEPPAGGAGLEKHEGPPSGSLSFGRDQPCPKWARLITQKRPPAGRR